MKPQDTINAPPPQTTARKPIEGAAPKRSEGGSRITLHSSLFNSLVAFFTSLRLTVVLLGLGLVLVFIGTLAQVNLGLYKAQNEFFRSFFIYWGPKGASWKLPVFPAGYLIGWLLLVNLLAAHFQRFTFTRKKIGLWMIHAGLILLLVGQLLTDKLARESVLHLREGEARNYSETQRDAELAVIDTTDPDSDKVVAIPQGLLMHRKDISHSELPFTVRIKQFFANSTVAERAPDSVEPLAATQGTGTRATVKELPRETAMDKRDLSSAVIELMGPQGSLGTWLVSEYFAQPESFTWNQRTYQMTLRPGRIYKPFTIQLLKFQHDIYAGTDIPKNFASRILLQRPDTGEKREVLIYMNNPLRYAGETYYQASFDEDDHGSVFQVVHNPSWLTPYFSCILVGAGLVVQFLSHLVPFIKRRVLT